MPARVAKTKAAPVTASERPLTIGETLGERAIGELRRAIACFGWRGAQLHRGVHQGRKSLRRARAMLALGMPALGPGGALVDREIRRVNRGASDLRDAQALIEALQRLKTGLPTPELAPIDASLRIARRQRATLARSEDVPARLSGAAETLVALAGAAAALPWSRIDERTIRESLQRSEARVESAKARALERGRLSDWHRWRRRERRLSQQHTALKQLVEIPAALRKSVKRTATLLGEAQDCVLANRRGTGRKRFPPELRGTIGDVAMRRLAELRSTLGEPSSDAS